MLTKASKYMMMAAFAAMGAGMTSCNDWLGEDSPGSTKLDDFFVNGTACIQTINGCYQPLMYEYNTTYYSEWFIGDIASDDALKGGQNLTDMAAAYDIENFKTNPNNEICLDYYRAKYLGIIRCNLALREIAKYEVDETLSQERKDCLLGEAYFLRGLYYFQLVRVFGGVALVHDVLDSSEKWQQPRASVEDVYASIISDLEQAEQLLFERDEYASEDLGRATKAAAQGMLCKVNLYKKDYDEAYKWGKKFIDDQYRTGKYSLVADYYSNFTTYGENSSESVFQIQYAADPTSDYGQGNGFTRGTFTTILSRPRLSSLGGNSGWGFNHPTHNLYAEYEPGDARRDLTIGEPDDADKQSVDVTYLGSAYYNRKTAYIENGIFIPLDHATRSPLNYNVMRVSDLLLLYAEAALESGKSVSDAKWALEEVRKRARALADDPSTALPQFPNYLGYSDNTESLRKAIRHERRVELAREGHRGFDLVRWGIAYEVMDKDNGSYGKTESAEARAEMANFIKGKHELLPIPAEERALNPMEQNPGY